MKLTTAELRKLIKEEVANVIMEADGSGGTYKKRLLRGLKELQETLIKLDLDSLATQFDHERTADGEGAFAKGLLRDINSAIKSAMKEISG